jgi:hypothetical protein
MFCLDTCITFSRISRASRKSIFPPMALQVQLRHAKDQLGDQLPQKRFGTLYLLVGHVCHLLSTSKKHSNFVNRLIFTPAFNSDQTRYMRSHVSQFDLYRNHDFALMSDVSFSSRELKQSGVNSPIMLTLCCQRQMRQPEEDVKHGKA